jgi:hypothetical protein
MCDLIMQKRVNRFTAFFDLRLIRLPWSQILFVRASFSNIFILFPSFQHAYNSAERNDGASVRHLPRFKVTCRLTQVTADPRQEVLQSNVTCTVVSPSYEKPKIHESVTNSFADSPLLGEVYLVQGQYRSTFFNNGAL